MQALRRFETPTETPYVNQSNSVGNIYIALGAT